jgi:uncharacterized membrane protein
MEQRKDKGVAGLTILLSLITMLFVIGLIVMIFSIMSGQIADTDILYTTLSSSVTAEAVTQASLPTGDALSVSGLRSVACVITAVTNGSAGGVVIGAGNYTESAECTIRNVTSTFVTANWSVNATYSYLGDTSGAVAVINDSSGALASVTDWYDIFIVIGAMVVLILLVVIIISAIKGSGMTDGAGNPNVNAVGTA